MRPFPVRALSLVALVGIALSLSFVFPTSARAAEDWSLEALLKQKSAWQGHGVGSSITETTTIKMPAMPNMPNMPKMPNMPGMPKDGKIVTTEKTTLTKITKDGFVLTIESGDMMGQKTSLTQTVPLLKTIKPTMTDGGEGSVSIEGKDYVCAIKNVTNMETLFGDAMEQVPGQGRRGPSKQTKMGPGKVYVHPKLGVLRLEGSFAMMGQKSSVKWQVKRLAVAHKLGSQTYTCREIVVTMGMSAGKTKMTMLSTNLVPGGSLKNVVEAEMMGMKTKITMEVTAYVKKPLKVTTAPAAK